MNSTTANRKPTRLPYFLRLWFDWFGISALTSSRLRDASAVRKSLYYSTIDGTAYGFFATWTSGSYLTGFVLLLGFTDIHLGILGALPFFATLPGLLATFAADQVHSRRRVMLPMTTIARLMWIPLMVLPFIPMSNQGRIWSFLAIFGLMSIYMAMAANTWKAWMSDLVPKAIRGRFWAARNQLISIGTILATLAAGFIADGFKERGYELAGYEILFGLGVVFAMVSVYYLTKKFEAPPAIHHDKDIWRKIRMPFRDRNYRPVLWGMTVFNFSLGLIAPFLQAYMINDLQLSYKEIAGYSIFGGVVGIVANRYWGLQMDRVGLKPVVLVTGYLTVLAPIMWMLSLTYGAWMIIALWLITGFGWAGWSLVTLNVPFALSPPEGRTYYLSVIDILSGLAFFVGSISGGWWAEHNTDLRFMIGPIQFVHYHVLMIASAVGRTIGILLLHNMRDANNRGVREMLFHTTNQFYLALFNITSNLRGAFPRKTDSQLADEEE